MPCSREEHCPPRYACGAGGVCVPDPEEARDAGPDDVDDDAGVPSDGGVDDAGPDGGGVDAGPEGPPAWWSAAHALAVVLDVTGGATAVADVPVVIDAPLQSLIGARGTLDGDSPRVIEHGASGAVELPSFFSGTDGGGALAFLLPGELAAGETRRLWLYLALVEEGGVGQPAYWLNEARNPVVGPSVAIDDLDSESLRTYHLTEPGLAVILNNCWRLYSTGVDHFGAPSQLGNDRFTPLQVATVRLDQPGLVVVESMASAGPARARLLTLLTSERGILSALRVEELPPGEPLEVYAYADIDIPDGDASDDTGLIDRSVDAAVIEDSDTSQQVALIHDGRGEAETVGVIDTVANQVRTRTLSAADELVTGDGAAAMRWLFPTVTAPVMVKDATLLVDGRSDAERIGRRFFAPTAVLGTVVDRP
ncbi:MAG: hypothetical protein HYS27_08155 [Deltaproteobacteria bacterium]|nr:hypothetical protein [Deltaproteobacteria bacterium]